MDPKLFECPLCLDVISTPLTQCQTGHPMCKKCFDDSQLVQCPICRGAMSDKRHVAFEQLLETFKSTLPTTCRYAHKGCKFDFSHGKKENHERECKFRTFRCEGKVFAGWKCDWVGNYDQIEKHFKTAHKNNTHLLQYKSDAITTKINFRGNFKDIHLISFFNGQAYFYYKHFVDVKKEKLYWAFQYIGLKSSAEHFFYEFEVQNGPVRKFKVSEKCHNDTVKSDDIFALEQCVVMPFATAKNYLNDDGELSFRYRILKTNYVLLLA